MKIISIDNSQNIIDSRDIIARIDDLVDDRRNLEVALEEAQTALADVAPEDAEEEHMQSLQEDVLDANEALEDWDASDDATELTALQALAEEGISEWENGAALIRDSHFEEYAMQLADELGATDSEAWPLNCIDWTKAADMLQQDYTSVSFDGVDYWVRA
jgi:hypothetical protein